MDLNAPCLSVSNRQDCHLPTHRWNWWSETRINPSCHKSSGIPWAKRGSAAAFHCISTVSQQQTEDRQVVNTTCPTYVPPSLLLSSSSFCPRYFPPSASFPLQSSHTMLFLLSYIELVCVMVHFTLYNGNLANKGLKNQMVLMSYQTSFVVTNVIPAICAMNKSQSVSSFHPRVMESAARCSVKKGGFLTMAWRMTSQVVVSLELWWC